MRVPAKINLYLNITGKRGDGYHLLDTLMTFVSVYDDIEITSADKFSLEINGEFAHLVENDEKNIVARACKLMAEECGASTSVAIKLTKNIPVGAGLGGGSADAAAALILLNNIYNASFSTEKLAAIGVKIGADVPIFINRHAAFVSGIGEKINNTDGLPSYYAVLVYPNQTMSTKDVFVKFSKSANFTGETPPPTRNPDKERWLPLIKNKSNDLENTAIEFLPLIKPLIEELSKLDGCAFARMSGSGSTCFALFTNKEKAGAAANGLMDKYPDYWVKVAEVLEKY